MAYKAIKDMMLENKENISEKWIRVARAICKQAPNWAIANDMMEWALIWLINSGKKLENKIVYYRG
jgi:hypothetical protein